PRCNGSGARALRPMESGRPHRRPSGGACSALQNLNAIGRTMRGSGRGGMMRGHPFIRIKGYISR
ncbi:MAG TPA: hypothetical protein VLM17_01985, partial [Xanthomonadaceae bacterium]|nr:hypothetical protein [Xanthomonadaceae bacterium]